MFFIEGKSFLNALIKRDSFTDACRQIICVAGKIDFPPLHHHEKTIAVIEQLDAPAHIIA